jgi:uncharacterized protein
MSLDWLAPDLTVWMLLALLCASFAAGFVDSVVGGGGLIQLPAMFAVFPGAAPAVLIGTNKVSAVMGTTSAAIQYARRTTIDWHATLPATIAALVFAFLGALAATVTPPAIFRVTLPVVLVGVAVYVFAKKEMGRHHDPLHVGREAHLRGSAVGAGLGFYDGIFGPGTGSFLAFVFVHWFGFDFLRATAAAKVVNVACNLAGIAAFAIFAQLWLGLALVMGIFIVAGSLCGSAVALKLGSGFIRRVFLGVVVALILKTAYDGLKLYVATPNPTRPAETSARR